MKKKYIERFVGKYCKIVTKEPGENRASVVTGILEDVDSEDGFILVDSNQGLGCLRIDTIVAIKPKAKQQAHHKTHEDSIVENDAGMVGIETLIVFIAMVLVDAVTASVLIQTSDTLSQRAKSISSQTIKEISSGLAIEEITGYTNPEKTRINYLALQVRTRSGSKDLDLSLCTLTILYNDLRVLTLNTSLVSHVNLDNKSVFYTPISAGNSATILNYTTNSTFGVISIHDPDGTVVNTYGLNSGDRVFIIVNLSAVLDNDDGTGWMSAGLPARESLSGALQPEIGFKASFDFTAPAVFGQRIVDLL
jgi:flagellin FlaB